MSTPKHTPGPWKAANSPNVYAPDGTYIASGVNNLEDRKLIAAAPEMLDYIRQVVNHRMTPDLFSEGEKLITHATA